ncbi:MAG: hypothetical protein ACOYPS_13920, partial [Phycisphaerales bacterium]
ETSSFGESNDTVINEGTIAADVPGRELRVQAASFTNNGTLRAASGTLTVSGLTGNLGSLTIGGPGSVANLNGTNWVNNLGVTVPAGTTVDFDGSWSNTGGITTAGEFYLDGSFTTAGIGLLTKTGGNVYISGTLNNAGTELRLNATTGSWTLAGGTIVGGTITGSDGATLSLESGRLDRVTLALNTEFKAGTLYVNNGLTLAGDVTLTVGPAAGTAGNATLYFEGTQTLGGIGTVAMRRNPFGYSGIVRQNQTGTTLTIGDGITVRGETSSFGESNDTVINEGTIVADVPGRELRVQAASFTNRGTLRAASGTLTVNGLAPNAGLIHAALNSTITINGNFNNTATGTLQIDIAGPNAADRGRINITGSATLAGTFRANFVNG